MRYEARAPLRIDFGGGWTDVPIYAEEHGGAVLNAAITVYVRGSIARPDLEGWLRTLRGNRSYLSYTLDAPAGAGLGASAAQNVLWVTLTRSAIANTASRREIAEIAWQVGGLLGILGGKQDEYASALGGIALYSFTDTVGVERLNFDMAFQEMLRRRLVLVYAGRPRLSGDLHERVWSRYREGDAQVRNALASLKQCALSMNTALANGDLDTFGRLLNDNWSAQKALHPSITTSQLEEVFERAQKHGALGGKACGAGGGGCMVFLAEEGCEAELRAALRASKLELIDFDFDTYGVFLKKG